MEQQNAGAPAQRPTFLTVLCILSFIASGFAIIWSIIVLIGAMAAQAIVSGTEAGMEMSENMSAETADAVSTTTSAGMGLVWAYVVLTILGTILSLVGVIKMWKLKKPGFYLYTAGSVISIIIGAVYELNIVGIVIAVAFIAMYAMNLKHMK